MGWFRVSRLSRAHNDARGGYIEIAATGYHTGYSSTALDYLL